MPSLATPARKRPARRGVSPTIAVRLLGKKYNYNTILWWVRTRLARASVQYTGKYWTPVLFSVTDVVELAVIGMMRQRKTKTEIIAKALEILRSEGGRRLGSTLCLCVADGDVRAIVESDIMRAVGANGSSYFINVGKIRQDLEAAARHYRIKLPEEA
jgi:hypothetical protein